MSPTAELRWICREHPEPFGVGGVIYRYALQQRWVQHHIPAGQTEAPSEWRDVPTFKEEK